jgi:hypothetical protein
MHTDAQVARIGGVCGIAGAVVLLVATMLHPMDAPPADAPAAFAEYARDRFWVATHLAQLSGAVSIGACLVALSWRMRTERAAAGALFAGVTTIVAIALAAALQAVDGVALKIAVDRWAVADASVRAAAFEAAYAIRQIEVGLASMVGALFGLAVMLHGIALALSLVAPKWLALFGILAGGATLASGIVQAHSGFSDFAMTLSMPASLSALAWSACAGGFLLKNTALEA